MPAAPCCVTFRQLPIPLPGQICYSERMNTSMVRQPIITHLSALVASVAFLLAGCSTTKKVDWDSRVGRFTYDQAIAELGPPDKQSRLGDADIGEVIISAEDGKVLKADLKPERVR